MSIVIQIVPRLSPPADGVGDYALCLAHQMKRDFQIETHFIVSDPNWLGSRETESFSVSQLGNHTSEDLIVALTTLRKKSSSIILQYVGGGYNRHACPLWLVKGLERYKASHPDTKIMTMFHETYGSGPPYYGQDPPWISAFWLAPVQKNIASRLVALSDRCLTNREHYKNQLIHLVRRQEDSIAVAPVFSNVGEAQHLSPLNNRHSNLVLFGSNRSRARLYEQFHDGIHKVCQALNIEKIYDIGPPTDLNITEIGNISVISLGERNVSEVGGILLDARAGILNYHPEFLGKSGMYAAYSAYGLIPIVASSNTVRFDDMDGLRAQEHYWEIARVADGLNLETGQKIASNAYSWYRSHNLSVHASIFADFINL